MKNHTHTNYAEVFMKSLGNVKNWLTKNNYNVCDLAINLLDFIASLLAISFTLAVAVVILCLPFLIVFYFAFYLTFGLCG